MNTVHRPERDPDAIHLGTLDLQQAFGIARICLLVFGFWLFTAGYSSLLQNQNLGDLVREYEASSPFLERLPDIFALFWVAITDPLVGRHLIAPTIAILIVLFGGAMYVKDIYALPNFRLAWQYVISSMFALSYPQIQVDRGKKDVPLGQVNLLDAIGGPGTVVVQPGSAAIFRHLRHASGISLAQTYFLAPFETIHQTVDIDEQQADREKGDIKATTRDGIKVVIKDLHFRYRITSITKEGNPAPRDENNPHPFLIDALRRMTDNLEVRKEGLEEWRSAVERKVIGQITDFIAAQRVDYLTAPRENGQDPRTALLQAIQPGVRGALSKVGAELLWLDFGHIEIEDDTVDNQRAELWAVEWSGDATITRAYGEARRLAYQELGRAEAQAELIMGLAEALHEAAACGETKQQLRKILMARTAQMLDAMTTDFER